MAVVGVDGKIAYYGGPGPGGFKPNEVWMKSGKNKMQPARANLRAKARPEPRAKAEVGVGVKARVRVRA